MVDQNQAAEIRQHLITQLASNGYGQIVDEALTRQELQDAREYINNPTAALYQFINSLIQVFRSKSNSDYEAILARFNNTLIGENKVRQMLVSLSDEDEQTFDLSNLPDYNPIINVLEEVQRNIYSEL